MLCEWKANPQLPFQHRLLALCFSGFWQITQYLGLTFDGYKKRGKIKGDSFFLIMWKSGKTSLLNSRKVCRKQKMFVCPLYESSNCPTIESESLYILEFLLAESVFRLDQCDNFVDHFLTTNLDPHCLSLTAPKHQVPFFPTAM